MDTWKSNLKAVSGGEKNTWISITLRKTCLWCWHFYNSTLVKRVSLFAKGFMLFRPNEVKPCRASQRCPIAQEFLHALWANVTQKTVWPAFSTADTEKCFPGTSQPPLYFILLIVSTKWDTVHVSVQNHHWTHCDTLWPGILWSIKGHRGTPQT